MELNKTRKHSTKFRCEKCAFECSKKSDWERHVIRPKHVNNENNIIKPPENNYTCKKCNKLYKYYSGLWKHNQSCSKIPETIQEENNDDATENITLDINENTIKTNIEVSYLSNLILEVVKNNSELQKQTCDLQKQNQEFQQELQKQNQDFQMQMMEICKTSNVNINSNNNNKTFNLQVFLNEECKDAMNLSEFIESIHLKLPDLLNVGKLGYTEGISKIILKELNETAQNKRPVHCSDIKRETMYVKQENKWEKEGPENLTIKNAIKNIEQKNIALLMNDWKAEHPDHMKSESSENDEYLRLVNQITSGSEDNLNKVVRRIAKDVMINKKNI
jgi:hypothetical protein